MSIERFILNRIESFIQYLQKMSLSTVFWTGAEIWTIYFNADCFALHKVRHDGFIAIHILTQSVAEDNKWFAIPLSLVPCTLLLVRELLLFLAFPEGLIENPVECSALWLPAHVSKIVKTSPKGIFTSDAAERS